MSTPILDGAHDPLTAESGLGEIFALHAGRRPVSAASTALGSGTATGTRDDGAFQGVDGPVGTAATTSVAPHAAGVTEVSVRVASGLPAAGMAEGLPRAIPTPTLPDAATGLTLERLLRLALTGGVAWSRFAQIARASSEALFCVNARGSIVFWNDACLAQFGYSDTEMAHCRAETLLPDLPYLAVAAGGKRSKRKRGGSKSANLVGWTVDIAAMTRDGAATPVEVSLSFGLAAVAAVDIDPNRALGLATSAAAAVVNASKHFPGSALVWGAIVRDTSRRAEVEATLYRLAHLDALTGLANRDGFASRLSACVAAGEPVDVLMIDLDDFKIVNDTWGHPTGDDVLRSLAHRLVAELAPGQLLARLGGDEFAIMLPGNAPPAALSAFSRRLSAAIAAPLEVESQEVTVGACVGIASFPADAGTADELLANADLALYQGKASGPLTHRFFVPALREAVVVRRSLEAELREALYDGQLELYYQPQVDLLTRRVLGAEALLRWQHPTRGLLTPADFLEVLETSSIAGAVGERILATACEQAAQWRAAACPDFQMSVNLFGRQISSGRLVASVLGSIAKYGLPTDALEIEITETTIVRRDEAILVPLRELCDAGVRIAFDDYGTGYASLSLLKNFPLTRLKIDKSFVTNIAHDAADMAVVQAIIFLANNFGLRVIAEGVETEAQARVLVERRCLEAQGFLFGKPVPAAEFGALHLQTGSVSGRL